MSKPEVRKGRCRDCGQALVQEVGERTYHPASVDLRRFDCFGVLSIPGTRERSSHVPETLFIPEGETAMVCKHRRRRCVECHYGPDTGATWD